MAERGDRLNSSENIESSFLGKTLKTLDELKKEKYCCVCGNEMGFYGPTCGYRRPKRYKEGNCSGNQYCKNCRNLNPESKQIRSRNYKDKAEQKKVEEGYYDLPEVCMICLENGIEERFEDRYNLSKHLSTHNGKHRFGERELEKYYIKYLGGLRSRCKRNGCNKTTRFISLIEGFADDNYCSPSCASIDRGAATILNTEEIIS